MRTRSQKANSGSPLQSLSQEEKQKKPRTTRAKKDAPAKAPARAQKSTAAKATTTTITPAATSTTTTTTAKATSTTVVQTMQTPTTTRRQRKLRVREPLQPRAAANAQQTPQLTGEELLQKVHAAREERRRNAQNVLPDDDDNNASPEEEAATPAQRTPAAASQSTPQQPSPAHQESPRQTTPHHKPSTAVQPATPATAVDQATPATPGTAGALSNPTTPATQVASQPATPRTTGWGIRSLFSSILPSVFSPGRSPAAATPATASNAQMQNSSQTTTQTTPARARQAQPAAQAQTQTQHVTPVQQGHILLNQDQVDEIGAGLAPSPTPIRTTHRRTTRSGARTPARKSSSSKSSTGDNAIITTAVRDVNAEQRALATAWAQKTAQKITADPSVLGSKRRQLEQPMKLKDVKDIPARRPWESTGSFGLLPEFFDDSDSDEEAPGWYLVDQLANEQPALKKRKISNGPTESTPVANESRHRIIDTNGNSASLYDLHPRPACVPSPMFDYPATHHEGANVFAEHKIYTEPAETPSVETPPRDHEAFMKELKRTGHVPGSGSFCVPEGDSDDSDNEDLEDQENTNPALPWTQQPPPAPTPAHAKLPVQPDTTSFVPATPRDPKAVDPVQAQRLKAMKHTPAKQSRLREVMLPSPSEAGSSPLVATASPFPFPSTPASALYVMQDYDMPDVCALDFGDQALLDAAAALVGDMTNDSVYGGSEVLYKYDEDDDTVSEEDDDML